MQGPHLLNVLRILDLPQALAMVAEKTKVRLQQTHDGGWGLPGADRESTELARRTNHV
jgi:hypothetical protein